MPDPSPHSVLDDARVSLQVWDEMGVVEQMRESADGWVALVAGLIEQYEKKVEHLRQCQEKYDGLEEQLHAAQLHAKDCEQRLSEMEQADNGFREQLESLRQALRDSWDDYANAIDEHTSEEVRKEARHRMLRRFSEFQDEGWLDSNPANEPEAS